MRGFDPGFLAFCYQLNFEGCAVSTIDNIEDRLFEMLPKELTVAREQLTRESKLEDIGFDSLAVIEFMFQVEDEFNIRFGQSGVPPKTLGEVFDQIKDAIAKAGQGKP
jgi:acyl carrier protein